MEFPPPGEPQTFPELLAEAAREGGERVAYRERRGSDWRECSYRDLEEQAQSLGSGLIALGVEPEDRVAIILENGIDWPVAFYAIACAGAVATPIYYGLKESEVGDLLAHAAPKVVITSAKIAGRIEEHLAIPENIVLAAGELAAGFADGASVLSIAEASGKGTDASKEALAAVETDPDALATILFTSGTSGGAKGVMLTHRNLLANVAQTRRVVPAKSMDRILLVLPLHHSFPFMVTLALAPALTGTLTFENDLKRIRDRMQDVQPTLFLGVPTLYDLMYRNVLATIESDGRMPAFEKGLRITRLVKKITGLNIGGVIFKDLHKRLGGKLELMVSGGAPLNPDTHKKFLELGLPLAQGWGMSETSPVLSVQYWNKWRFLFTRYYEKRVGSIGKAIPGVDIKLRAVPALKLEARKGGEGELVARGENVTQGYWQAPQLTEELKVGEWLRTGDLGTIDRDGTIRITGRSKFVIVLDSGENVYPDEVEERLAEAPLIEDIAIIGVDIRGKQRVRAIVYPNRSTVVEALGDNSNSAEAVLEAVAESLRERERNMAAFKRVTDIVLADEPLPRTALRKIMRGHLRDAYDFDPGRWAESWPEYLEAQVN